MTQVLLSGAGERARITLISSGFHTHFRFDCQPPRSMGRPLLVVLSALVSALAVGCGGSGDASTTPSAAVATKSVPLTNANQKSTNV
jgi:hypothetical protein